MELIKMHRAEDGHEIEFDRQRIVLIEPAPEGNGTIVVVDHGQASRELRLAEGYEEVVKEVHMSFAERMMRSVTSGEGPFDFLTQKKR